MSFVWRVIEHGECSKTSHVFRVTSYWTWILFENPSGVWCGELLNMANVQKLVMFKGSDEQESCSKTSHVFDEASYWIWRMFPLNIVFDIEYDPYSITSPMIWTHFKRWMYHHNDLSIGCGAGKAKGMACSIQKDGNKQRSKIPYFVGPTRVRASPRETTRRNAVPTSSLTQNYCILIGSVTIYCK